MNKRFYGIAIGCVCALVGLTLTLTANTPAQATMADSPVSVSITECGFDPAMVTIMVGTTVVWTNHTQETVHMISGEPYRIYLPLVLSNASSTSAAADSPPMAAAVITRQQDDWVDEDIAPGESYTYTFTMTGNYPYFLAGHARKTGLVIVQEAPDDAVALDALLEASGYDWSHNLWADVAAGNFCGGAEQELVVVQNLSPYFSILRGPTPFVRAAADLGSSPAHTWSAVAAGNFDLDGYQEIVAVRNVTASGVPDVFIIDLYEDCNLQVESTRTVGSPTNSDWVDVAVGNFDGVGEQEIALVKNKPAYFVFLRFFDGTWSQYLTAALGSRHEYPWKALAAGDLDGVPGDELVAVRKVTDGARYTVGAYRWDGAMSNFSLFATSTFANTGNHTWISAAAGNFGGDDREAIALVKNKHSNFVVLDYPPGGGSTLRLLAGADLDTAPGQSWRGLAAADWLDEDHGYEELIAVRNLQPNPDETDKMYQTDFFVYGNSFHRAVRAGALAGTEAVIAGNERRLGSNPETWDFHSVEAIKAWLAATHTNTYNVMLRLPDEYAFLVEFLEATRDFCVDGRQLRVWITLAGPSETPPHGGFCSRPSNSPLTSWDELEYFKTLNDCTDFVGWFSMLSRLAQDYPHIVAVGIDDFLSVHNQDTFTPGYVAELQSRLRWPSEWLSFVPTVYWEYFYFENGQRRFPDLPLTFDTMIFYFTNTKHGTSDADETVLNAPEEIADMAALLPGGRSLQFGAYLSCIWSGDYNPSIQLGHDLLNTALAQPLVAGTTVYTGSSLWGGTSNIPGCNRPPPPTVCEAPLDHRFCVVQSVYGSH